MKRRIKKKGYMQLSEALNKQTGIVIGEPVSSNIYDVTIFRNRRLKKNSTVCKVYINSSYSKAYSEYVITASAHAAAPESFMQVYGRPIPFKLRDTTFGGVRECCALLMEKGEPFRTDSAPMHLSRYAEFLRETATAAKVLHENGIVHMDIKPANIVTRNGYCCLIDFNISKFISYNAEINVYDFTGSKFFMCPDVFKGIVSKSCDIYSLGMTIRSILLNGAETIHGSCAEEILKEKRALEPLDSDDDEVRAFLEIINRMTAFSMNERYHSMDEVLRDVDRLAIDPHTRLYSAYEETG